MDREYFTQTPVGAVEESAKALRGDSCYYPTIGFVLDHSVRSGEVARAYQSCSQLPFVTASIMAWM